MSILLDIEKSRLQASREVEIFKQKLNEQYFTPVDVAKYMVSLLSPSLEVNILDAGAGVGNLGCIAALKYLESSAENVTLCSVERDPNLYEYLRENILAIQKRFSCCKCSINNIDFYSFAKKAIADNIRFNRVIINPPYSKISSRDENYSLLQELNVITPNAYTSFIKMCLRLMDEDGELVAIVPRSFCNGTLFTHFRVDLLKQASIHFIHLFNSRKKVFQEYGINQEVVIIKIVKNKAPKPISICISDKLDQKNCTEFEAGKVIFRHDPYQFIHIPNKETDDRILGKIAQLPSSLEQLGLTISTGKIVDFRETENLSFKKNLLSGFLIYKDHIVNGELQLDKKINKPIYLDINDQTIKKTIPIGNYVIMKRMSFKEDKGRIQSLILTKDMFGSNVMAIENHLNYIHKDGKSLDLAIATGLNAFLTSQTVDEYIRRFSGHTQINASDIRSLPMPSYDTLAHVGKLIIRNRNIPMAEIETLIFGG